MAGGATDRTTLTPRASAEGAHAEPAFYVWITARPRRRTDTVSKRRGRADAERAAISPTICHRTPLPSSRVEHHGVVTVVSLVSNDGASRAPEPGLFVPFYGAYLGSALAAREARTLAAAG